jgi:hypothetical protein
MAAEMAGALLAHDPAKSIDNIGLAAAVGAYDGGDSRSVMKRGLPGEGLKADHFKTFESHRFYAIVERWSLPALFHKRLVSVKEKLQDTGAGRAVNHNIWRFSQ